MQECLNMNDVIYVEDDDRMDLIMKFQDQAMQTAEYVALERAAYEASERSTAYWKSVDAEAMRMFKERGAELFADLSEEQQQRTANTVFRSRAQQIIGPAPSLTWQRTNQAIDSFVRAYVEARMPERNPYADAARQRRDQQSLESFKRWHAGSKVVDREGNPIIAFHSTARVYDVFQCGDDNALRKSGKNPDYSGALGAWFAAPPLYDTNYDEGAAESTAEEFVVGRDGISEYREGANTMPVYLAIKNPKEFGDYEDFQDERDSYKSQWHFKQKMLEAGHDGFVIRNCDTDGCNDRDDWVAFYPQQVKSALGNSGAFDPASPSLTDASPALAKVATRKPRAVTQLAAFKAWFADSKVVDEQQCPLVVYHGTQADVNQFDEGKQGSVTDDGFAGAGFYFTDDAEVASAYSGFSVEDTGGNVMPVYLSLQNPKIISSYSDLYPDGKIPGNRTDAKRVRNALMAQGHDGVIMRGKSMNQYVAFSPQTIKSALGNSGAFDPASPSLTDAAPALVKAAESKRRAPPLSDAFNAWFGSSRVVDDVGLPLVAYHGTDADFDMFDVQKIGSASDDGHLGRGFYFSTDPRVIGRRTIGMPVYLRALNPLIVQMPDFRTDKRALVPHDLGDHDAVILDYSPTGYNHKEIMVRSPEQVKSALGNSGAYDPKSASLTDAAPAPEKAAAPLVRSPQSEAFKRWHGKSQLVLPTGAPMIAFHGTNKDIDVFEPGGKTQAIFVTVDPAYASVVAETKGWGNGDNVMPVYVRAENPMFVSESEYSFDAIRQAKQGGFDALVTTADDGSVGRTIALFSPHQLKSALGNVGTFDPESPSLTDHEEVRELEHDDHAMEPF
jgi:hypothetical protein